MSSGRGNFLVTLLRQGAPVLAVAPQVLPDEIDDSAPVPAVRRMTAMATSDASAPRDPLMTRASRYGVLLPLVYRIFMLPVVWVWLVTAFGIGSAHLVTAIAAIGVVSNLLGCVWVLRVPDRQGLITHVLLYGDTAFAVLANLLVGVVMPAELYWPGTWVTFVYLTGTAALWTINRGVPTGLLVVVLSVPLQSAMLWLGHLPHIGSVEVAGVLSGAGMLFVAVLSAAGALILVGLGTRLALAIGLRMGRAAERARAERAMHDTVLQALEVMAMSTSDDGTDPAAQLNRLRGAARAQANELRRSLDTAGDGSPPDGLAAELAAMATEMARDGLRAELAIADVDDGALSEVRRIAVREAVREALRNTIKHAGTREVVVRMEERDGGIAVIARDHGIGYDEDERPPGFGVTNSMKARLAEVGGHCDIDSRPGRGTKVTLWVPV